MTPWSGTMIRGLLLTFAVITGFTAEAITVTIDRADVKTLQPQSSMQLNGWRPVTTKYQEIGVNVSPASNLERNAAPLHPVLNKLQEHMAASERQKARKNKPQDYSPPSILGSFSVFGHATAAKSRGEANNEGKHDSKATKEYSFLLPPPRDAFRFEVDSHKKMIFRDNEPYVRQTQFVPQIHKPDLRGPTYYVKTGGLGTTNHPAQKNRPIISAYNVQQFIPPLHSPKEFESLKVINDNSGNDNKHILQYPKTSVAPNYVKDGSSERNYNRFPPQAQLASGTGTFYSHAPNFKTTFERDPSFLVHESHEIGYATPSYDYKYRQPGAFESYVQHELYSTPRPDVNKFVQPVNNNYRNEPLKTLEKNKLSEKMIHPTYYVAEPHRDFIIPPGVWHMKQSYKSDINEVLPKSNRPAQFHQPSPIHAMPQQPQKLVYVRPELQQQQQKQSYSSVIPLNINQRPAETEYETPESISLKHFNEQQFMLQHQLIEQDRRRLREHELQRQKVLERQQMEEISKKQEEIRVLEQQQQQTVDETDLKKENARRPQHSEQSKNHKNSQHQRFPAGERVKAHAEKEHSKPVEVAAQKERYEVPQRPTESNFQDHFESTRSQNPEEFFTTQSVNLQEDNRQTEFRPARPAKPLRRRKPIYDNLTPTEYSTESPTAFESYTEIPVQATTFEAISTTLPSEKHRTRKPGGNFPRRRRPITTTPEPKREATVDNDNEDYLKYDRPEVSDGAKRRRVTKPAVSYEVTGSDRKFGYKKTGQKYSTIGSDIQDVVVTSEAVTQSTHRYKEPENLEKPSYFNNENTPTENTPTFLQVNPEEYQVESVTEYPKAGIEYAKNEGSKLTKFEYYEPTARDDRVGQYAPHTEENLPLEHLFVKTEHSNYETTTPVPVSTGFHSVATPTRTTVKISKSQEQSRVSIAMSSTTTTPNPPLSTTKPHHRIRPLRYGNATRPRFSVKEYKSRLDYKNKLMQASSSSTEPSVRQKATSLRNSQQTTGENFRETPGRYRYMSRVLQKTTSTTPASADSSSDSGNSSTTERTNKFTPKRRTNATLYRNRFAGGSQAKPSKHESVESSSSTHNASRVENVFSSVRRRVPHPGLKTSGERSGEKKGSPSKEMAAEETSFYNQPTTTQSIESVNEITGDKESGQGGDRNNNEATIGNKTEEKNTESSPVLKESNETVKATDQGEGVTTFSASFDEELFAKASQSVADLTSSASALYNKPGMFKAVSSVKDARGVKGVHITTEEPTLPIEAFFHEFSKN